MKKLVAFLLALVMCLFLVACGGSGESNVGLVDEERMLFDKYVNVIYSLENGEYNYAIQEIIRMSNEGREDLTNMEQMLQGEWYPEKDVDEEVPSKITFRDGGAVDIDGKAYTFLLEHSSSENIWGWLLEDGTCRYSISMDYEADWGAPRLNLDSARETPDGYRNDKWLATYYNDAMLPWLLTSWRNFSDDESMDDYISLGHQCAQVNDREVNWTVTAVEGQNLTVEIDNGAYTAEMEIRGKLPILTLTENATGNTACYYAYYLGYDITWPEFIYPKAVQYLNECLDEVAEGYTPGFWDYTVEEEESYSGNAAWKRLHELFTALGDYKDSTEIASRFTIWENMYTGATLLRVDNMGNESKNSEYEYFKYNAQGQMLTGKSWDIQWMYGGDSYAKYFTYDEDGRISKIQQGSGNYVEWTITPVCDSEGRMVGGTYKSNDYTHEVSYTYDAQGRLIENIVWNGSGRFKHAYTYDANGNLVKDVYWYGYNESNDYKSYRYTVDYTYDANGYVTKRVLTREYYSSWDGKFSVEEVLTWSYTNDAQGRPVSADYTTVDGNGESDYATQTITYHYDDLYFFD